MLCPQGSEPEREEEGSKRGVGTKRARGKGAALPAAKKARPKAPLSYKRECVQGGQGREVWQAGWLECMLACTRLASCQAHMHPWACVQCYNLLFFLIGSIKCRMASRWHKNGLGWPVVRHAHFQADCPELCCWAVPAITAGEE